jgi:pyridoxal phosphate enzyme (YggS family)
MRIADNLEKVNENIAAAAARAGRDPADVTLVVVTKTRTPDEIREAAAAGVETFGENRVQEATAKIPELADLPVSWHMVGHLQRNKVKAALELFDVVQSLDSLRLAAEIDKRASAPVPCLLEVNTSGEESKFGVTPPEVETVISGLTQYPNIGLRGLMTVGPLTADEARIKRAFAELAGRAIDGDDRRLRDSHRRRRDHYTRRPRHIRRETLLINYSISKSSEWGFKRSPSVRLFVTATAAAEPSLSSPRSSNLQRTPRPTDSTLS